jgi:hypothetical protein
LDLGDSPVTDAERDALLLRLADDVRAIRERLDAPHNDREAALHAIAKRVDPGEVWQVSDMMAVAEIEDALSCALRPVIGSGSGAPLRLGKMLQEMQGACVGPFQLKRAPDIRGSAGWVFEGVGPSTPVAAA